MGPPAASHLAHWDDIAPVRREAGHLAGAWADLGSAAGSDWTGVQRIQVDPGRWSTPAHAEGTEEEVFFVLGGAGVSWLDGDACAVGPGDCIVYLAETTHTLRAGPEGLEVLAFGQRSYETATNLPRAGVAWLGSTWVVTGEGGHPWEREVAAGPLELGEPGERPASVVNLDQVEGEPWGQGERVRAQRRKLSAAGGSVRTGLQHCTVEPGRWSTAPHCHSAEEEIFVVLDGDGVVLLGDDEHPVRRGSIVARPAGTGVAHAFRAGGDGLAYLAFGTREPNDMCWYPRSRKIWFRGLGVITRVEQPLDRWDGEE